MTDGRPLADREPGSGAKLRAYFEITHRPWIDITNVSKRLDHEKSRSLPSLRTLKQWAGRDIPVTKLATIADALSIPVTYFSSNESFENFRTYVANRSTDISALLPVRKSVTEGQMFERLFVLIQHNDNTKRVLLAIIHSQTVLSVDEIAGRIGISTIQLREILEGLMVENVVEIAGDEGSSLRSGPARMRLTAAARANKASIEGVIHAAA
jgi:hypothetical protein